MLKKIISLVLAGAVISAALPFGTLAEEAPAGEQEKIQEKLDEDDGSYISLSLEEAIEKAKTDNPQLEACDAAILSAEFALEVANLNQKDFDAMNKKYKVVIDVSSGLDMAYLKHGYYPFAAVIALEIKKKEKQQVEAKIAYDVTEKYFNTKLAERLLGISESSLVIAEENANIVKKQFELGLVSDLEVKNAEAAVADAAYSVESSRRSLNLAADSLKVSLLMDEEVRPLKLTDDIKLPEMPRDPEGSAKKAMETRYDVTALKKAVDLQERYFAITSMYMNEKTAKYHSANSDYISAKYNYDNAVKMINLAIRGEYLNIQNTSEAVESAKRALEIKEIEYESAKIRYEMGVITNLQLTAVMTELDGCKVQLEKANLDYMLAVERYNYDISIGL